MAAEYRTPLTVYGDNCINRHTVAVIRHGSTLNSLLVKPDYLTSIYVLFYCLPSSSRWVFLVCFAFTSSDSPVATIRVVLDFDHRRSNVGTQRAYS